jgi:hypothetical protein
MNTQKSNMGESTHSTRLCSLEGASVCERLAAQFDEQHAPFPPNLVEDMHRVTYAFDFN